MIRLPYVCPVVEFGVLLRIERAGEVVYILSSVGHACDLDVLFLLRARLNERERDLPLLCHPKCLMVGDAGHVDGWMDLVQGFVERMFECRWSGSDFPGGCRG